MSLDREMGDRRPAANGHYDDDNRKTISWASSWTWWIRIGTGLAVGLALLALTLQLLDSGIANLPFRRKWKGSAYPVVDPMECGSPQERIENVMRWAKQHGAWIHPNITASAVATGGRGLVAKGEIKAGAPLFQVPQHLLLNLKTVRKDPEFVEYFLDVPEMHDGFSGLAVYMIHEAMNKTSFWRPYLCSLPEWVPLPLFWSAEKRMEKFAHQVPEHQRDHFDKMSRRLRRYIDGKYYTVMPSLHKRFPQKFKEKDYSGARWAWAGSILLSRTWAQLYKDPMVMETTGKETMKIQTLVPAADLPNHRNDGSPGKFQTMKNGDKSLRLDASKHHYEGDQVFISYGEKCDAEYLASYGFIPEGNSGIKCHTNSSVGAAKALSRQLNKKRGKLFGSENRQRAQGVADRFRKALKSSEVMKGRKANN